MGIVLENAFSAKHLWIKSKKDKVKLDCMFFTSPHAKRDLDSARQNAADQEAKQEVDNTYLEAPTFILCNSNAMFYQQMIH